MNIREIYNGLIMHHYKNPYHRYKSDDCSVKSEAANLSCGDEVVLYLKSDSEEERIDLASFTSKGCVICRASASMLTKFVEGKTIEEAKNRAEELCTMINEDKHLPSGVNLVEQKYLALTYITKFPTRKQCVILAWDALIKGLIELRQNTGRRD